MIRFLLALCLLFLAPTAQMPLFANFSPAESAQSATTAAPIEPIKPKKAKKAKKRRFIEPSMGRFWLLLMILTVSFGVLALPFAVQMLLVWMIVAAFLATVSLFLWLFVLVEINYLQHGDYFLFTMEVLEVYLTYLSFFILLFVWSWWVWVLLGFGVLFLVFLYFRITDAYRLADEY